MKKFNLICIFVFLISSISALAVISTFETEGGYSTSGDAVYECYSLDVLPSNTITNMSIDLADQIVPQGGRLLVWDNVTGDVVANVTIGTGNIANFNMPAQNQVAGRNYIMAFVNYDSPTWTRVFKADSGLYPKTSGGIFIEGSAQPADTNISKEQCAVTQFGSTNSHGVVSIEWNNASVDSTSPAINITNINGSTSIKNGDVYNISATITDETALSSAIIYTNVSGYSNNQSFALSGTSAVISRNFTNSLTRGNVINITINASDGTNRATNSTTITIADSSPVFTFSLNNTSPLFGTSMQASYKVLDNDTTSTTIISWNCTSGGIWINITNSTNQAGTPFNTSANITPSLNRGNVCGITAYSNDSVRTFTPTSITTFTISDTPPSFTLSINNTSPRINYVVQISSLTYDNDTLIMVISSWNCSSSGLWINVSNITLNSQFTNYSINQSVGRARGNTCNWLFYSNDSTNANFTASSISSFIVANTAPNGSNIVNASGGTSVTRNLTLNWTSSTDADSDILRYLIWHNSSNFIYLYLNTTFNNLTTNFTNSGNYTFFVNVTDGIDTTSAGIFNVEFTPPVAAVEDSSAPKSSGGGGITSSITVPVSLKNPFGTPSSRGCKEDEQEFEGRCYPCDIRKGYLKFNPDDRSVLCVECAEGFGISDGECKLLPPKSMTPRFNYQVDFYARKISNALNTDNLLVGFFILIVFGLTILNYSWKFIKKQNGKR